MEAFQMLSNALTRYFDLQSPPHDLRQQLGRPTWARNAELAWGALQTCRQELLSRWSDGGRSARMGFFQQSTPPLRDEPFQPAPDGIRALASQFSNFGHGVTIR
jgi:hypothetical protein